MRWRKAGIAEKSFTPYSHESSKAQFSIRSKPKEFRDITLNQAQQRILAAIYI